MKRNKIKIIILVIILIALLILITKRNTNKNYQITYSVNNSNQTFNVIEEYDYKNKKYYIEINIDDKTFFFVTKESKIENKEIVTSISYYSDDKYTCILPLIDNKNLTDIQCYNEGTLYNYYSINGKDEKLDQYVKSLSDYNYNQWLKSKNKKLENDLIQVYDNDKKVYITNYKGLYSITDTITDIKLFDNDIYKQPISLFINNNYLIADYNQKLEFDKFYLVNLNNNKIETIKSQYNISFNSYIQGTVNNIVYLYDINHEVQYKIDIKSKKISEINSEKVTFYQNSQWIEISKQKANQEIYFESEKSTLNDKYIKISENDDFIYVYYNDDGKFEIYSIPKENEEILLYICTITDINNIQIKDNYIYYHVQDKLITYDIESGYQTVLSDSELEFNNNIKYYIEN
jgi:hypothetical protein